MNAKIYKCFIASPSDTQEEREICDKVFLEINKTLGEQLQFRIESKKWEKDVRPSFSEDGQSVINEQLLKNYQLFIGLMWNRFGTATKRAESGTEEEFNQAYSKYVNDRNDIEIMMYFNDAPAKIDSLDLDQVVKVQAFKKKVSDLGGLYSKYENADDFKEKLKRHLNDFFVSKLSHKTNNKYIKEDAVKIKEAALRESVSIILNGRLNDALSLFSNQPIVWVDPVISKTNGISENADENYDKKVNINQIIDEKKSLIIKSPPQFGLTCLAHHIIKKAWEDGKTFVYLDAKKIRRDAVKKFVDKELSKLNIEGRKIDGIVLDTWCSSDTGAKKLISNLCHEYKEVPILIMQTIDDCDFTREDSSEKVGREFQTLHLLALPRHQIRKVICNYNNEVRIGDEDIVLKKMTKDFDVLNIHRTPLNCLTLLKASEGNFDESPVNRTRLIEMVLFVLFDIGEIPTYKSKPDIKDCEYVLGHFCQKLIISGNYEFSREIFLTNSNKFCEDKLIELENSLVFDILFSNNIIVKRGSLFCFKSSYWIHYFSAKRMYVDVDFKEYMLSEKRYVSFPEIIEFYTGIDRNRSDLLNVLSRDIKNTRSIVNEKVGLPEDLDPLRLLEWKPTEESIQKMQEEIEEDVIKSNLPDLIKDKYADNHYNQLKPYNQGINHIFHDYSLVVLMQSIRACSRALRNSDYVDPDLKRSVLKEITNSWKKVAQVLFALTPALAEKGRADFDGQGFYLADDFGSTFEERIVRILQAIPGNILGYFRDDLYSNKIGPLLFDGINSEDSDLVKHQLSVLLILERPKNWRHEIERYIKNIPKDSFYLQRTVMTLRGVYKFDYASDTELQEIIYLLKMGIAKHELGLAKPDMKSIKRISNKVLPKREIIEEE